jgi:F0F1-type ATP synthase membrane subunit b/b'
MDNENTQLEMSRDTTPVKEKNYGALIGSIIIVILIIIGGMYFWGSIAKIKNNSSQTISDPVLNEMAQELDTEEEDFEAELLQIEAELEASLQE